VMELPPRMQKMGYSMQVCALLLFA